MTTTPPDYFTCPPDAWHHGKRKNYEGSRAGDFGTAIIVQVLDGVDGGEYPLPYVDAHQAERDLFGSSIPGADTLGTRTFEWGYHGAGARDTAASILADWTGGPQPLTVIHRFKDDVVARLGGGDRSARWSLTHGAVDAWVRANLATIRAAQAELLTQARLHNGDFTDADLADPPSAN